MAAMQAIHITLVSLRSISGRLGESLVVTVGIACVVFVLVMTLALASSLTDAIATTGHPDRALVLRHGSVVESLSSLSRENAARLRFLPGIARQRDGDVAVSPEVLVNAMLDDVDGLVLIRGLTPSGFELRPEVRVVEGRTITEGQHELTVGRLAQRSAPSLAIGRHLKVGGVDWRIVGVFESGGDAHESELFADGPTLMAAVGRNELSSATVQLLSADHFGQFHSAVAAVRGANLKAERESDYYRGQAETMSRLSYVIAYVVGAIMAFGATCGALNMTYSTVDARTVEVATLRAIGFGAFPITVAVLVESTLLAVIGAVAGALLAWVFVDGNTFAATQYLGPGASVNHLTLRLDVAAGHMAVGVVWACGIGLIGALLPALRATNRSIARSLQTG